MKRRIKVNGFLIFLAVMAILVFPGFFLRMQDKNFALAITGLLIIILGQLIRISARGYKAENSGSGRFLIQSGPYSLVRNPMYLGILFIGTGVVVVLFKWWVVLIFVAAFLSRYLILTASEEKKLLEVFPEEYPVYCKNTPRIIPSPRALFKKNIKECLPFKRAWFKKEANSICAVLSAVALLKWYSYLRK